METEIDGEKSSDGTVSTEPRMTRQGVRDLNNYGPKPRKAGATPRPVVDGGETATQEPPDAKTSDSGPAEPSSPIVPS